jgi:hypothetical protein
VLDWYENLVPEEVPPQWMWIFPEELDVWFDNVERERKNRYGGKSGDDGMMQNEYAKGRG